MWFCFCFALFYFYPAVYSRLSLQREVLICGSCLFPWCPYLHDGWLQAPDTGLVNTELEGLCIIDSQDPGGAGSCTRRELDSLWRDPPCGCLSWGRSGSQGAGGGGELCPNYGEQEYLVSFLGATPKPELSWWSFCPLSFSPTERTFPLKAIFKTLFSALGFLMTHDLAFPKCGSVQQKQGRWEVHFECEALGTILQECIYLLFKWEFVRTLSWIQTPWQFYYQNRPPCLKQHVWLAESAGGRRAEDRGRGKKWFLSQRIRTCFHATIHFFSSPLLLQATTY